MFEVEGVVSLEEDRELAAFRAEPKAVLAAEHVDVGDPLSRGDVLAVEPAKAEAAQASRRARHDASLICGDDGDLRVAGSEEDHVVMLSQKFEIVSESEHGLSLVEVFGWTRAVGH